MSTPREFFRKFANQTSRGVGSPWAFILAVLVILGWAITGPIFHFSDTWQLVINTSTTIITFLMVFLIQNTQNRDAVAIHIKLDELIRALKGARNKLVDLEELSDEELEQLQQEFHRWVPRRHRAPSRITREKARASSRVPLIRARGPHGGPLCRRAPRSGRRKAPRAHVAKIDGTSRSAFTRQTKWTMPSTLRHTPGGGCSSTGESRDASPSRQWT